MATSTTSSTTTTTSRPISTTKPHLKPDVPSLAPRATKKQPWESLLMGDPGSDYDQHESRLLIVDYMLRLAHHSDEWLKMVKWRENAVFDDEDEAAPPAKRTDSGITMREGRFQDGSFTSNASSDADPVTMETSAWKASTWEETGWEEADKVTKKNEFNEYGLWYGKPWEVSR